MTSVPAMATLPPTAFNTLATVKVWPLSSAGPLLSLLNSGERDRPGPEILRQVPENVVHGHGRIVHVGNRKGSQASIGEKVIHAGGSAIILHRVFEAGRAVEASRGGE